MIPCILPITSQLYSTCPPYPTYLSSPAFVPPPPLLYSSQRNLATHGSSIYIIFVQITNLCYYTRTGVRRTPKSHHLNMTKLKCEAGLRELEALGHLP
jgi:hypothetical protein